jgi:PEGA domain-containing protein
MPAEPVLDTVVTFAIVNITADATGADIEVDGAYVGSTPSTQKLTPGSHKILIRNDKRVWERTIVVQSDTTITVHGKLTE